MTRDLYEFNAYPTGRFVDVLWGVGTVEVPHFCWQTLNDYINFVTLCHVFGDDAYVKNWTFGL